MEMNTFVIPKDGDSIATALWCFIINIAIARYEYLGIDIEESDVDIDDIERAFLRSPYCAITRNKQGKLCALPCIPTKWNYKRKPEIVTIYSFMNDTKHFDVVKADAVVGVDCVVIENNEERIDTISLVAPYIKRLETIWKEQGNNLKLSKVFAIINSSTLNDTKFKQLVKDLFDKGIMLVNSVAKNGFMQNLEKFDLKVPYEPEKYHKDFDDTFIKMLNVLGINTANVEKRERLLVDEVNANNSLTKIIERSTLMYREQGIKKVNKKYNVNFEVKPIQILDSLTQGGVENEPEEMGEITPVVE